MYLGICAVWHGTAQWVIAASVFMFLLFSIYVQYSVTLFAFKFICRSFCFDSLSLSLSLSVCVSLCLAPFLFVLVSMVAVAVATIPIAFSLAHEKTTCAYSCMLIQCTLMTLRNRIRMRLVYFHKRDRTCLSFVEKFSTRLIKIKRQWWNLMCLCCFLCIKRCIAFCFVSILFHFISCQFSWLLHSKIVIRSTSYLALNKFVVARLNETWIAKLNCASEPNATRKKTAWMLGSRDRERKLKQTNKKKYNCA